MVDGHLFDTIAAIADQLRRKTDRPFGGIQVSPVYICLYDDATVIDKARMI